VAGPLWSRRGSESLDDGRHFAAVRTSFWRRWRSDRILWEASVQELGDAEAPLLHAVMLRKALRGQVIMAKRKDPTDTISVRVDPELKRQLEGNAKLINNTDGVPIGLSTYVRSLLSVENALVRKSPYICTKAHHFVFVAASGEVFYHRTEALYFESEVKRLIAKLTMKSEKREYFTNEYAREAVPGVWLLNYFALWGGKDPGASLIDEATDRHGLSTKIACFDQQVPTGATILREGCFVLHDYAQYLDPKPGSDIYDHVDIAVDVPTRAIDLTVVIDPRLYKETERYGSDFQHTPTIELRNREEVVFTSKQSVQTILDKEFFRQSSGRFLDSEPATTGRNREIEAHIAKMFSDFQRRLDTIRSEKPEALGRQDAVQRLENLRMPAEYLFDRAVWTWPHIGFYLSVKWARPERSPSKPPPGEP
jgi:hypothetical protein